jgi:hypothetical protein
MANSAQCRFADLVQTYLDGSMDDITADAFEAHISHCDRCLALLGQTSRTSVPDHWLEVLQISTPGDLVSRSPDQLPAVAAVDDSLPEDGLRYLCTRLIGTGGCGEVWEAWDHVLGRAVALKLLREPSPSARETERLIQEAEALARLSHPNIVSIFELHHRRGRPALVMEFVRGPSLAQYLRGQPCAPLASAGLLEKLCRALEHAHSLGVIHRDLKPSNILLKPIAQSSPPLENSRPAIDQFSPKIADFGLARLADQPTLTLPGQLLGTPSYMAPEQIGNTAKNISSATDVYGLGAILYEMLCARPPFASSDPALTMAMIQRDEPPPPHALVPGIPRDIETICLKCLAKEPHRRYPSVTALQQDLLAFLQHRPISAKPASRATKCFAWCRRHPAVTTAILTTCCLLGTVTASAIHFSQVSKQLRLEALQKSRLADEKEKLQARQQELIRAKFQLVLRIHQHFLMLLGDPNSPRTVDVQNLRPEIMRSASELSAPYIDMLVQRFRDGSPPSPDEIRLAIDYSDMAFVAGTPVNLASRLPELRRLTENISPDALPPDQLLESLIRLKSLEARLAAHEGNHLNAGFAYRDIAELIDKQLAVMAPDSPDRDGRITVKAGMLMNARLEFAIANNRVLAIEVTRQAEDASRRLAAADPNNQQRLTLLLEIRCALAHLLPPTEAATLAHDTLQQLAAIQWNSPHIAEKATPLLEQLSAIAQHQNARNSPL